MRHDKADIKSSVQHRWAHDLMMKLFLVVILMDALAAATTKIKRVPREEYKLDFGPDTRDTAECFEVDLKVYKIAELILGDNMKMHITAIERLFCILQRSNIN